MFRRFASALKSGSPGSDETLTTGLEQLLRSSLDHQVSITSTSSRLVSRLRTIARCAHAHRR